MASYRCGTQFCYLFFQPCNISTRLELLFFQRFLPLLDCGCIKEGQVWFDTSKILSYFIRSGFIVFMRLSACMIFGIALIHYSFTLSVNESAHRMKCYYASVTIPFSPSHFIPNLSVVCLNFLLIAP